VIRLHPTLKVFMVVGFFASSIPELLTGSSPFSRYILPHIFILLMIVYGVPAILILDYSVKRGLRYSDVLILGLTVGVIIEGLAVNTYYNPASEVMGDFSSYGRIYGVNLNWMVYITIFHALFSLTVPLAVSLLILGEEGLELRLSNRLRMILLILLLIVLLLFNISQDVYRPPSQYYILSFILIILIYYFHRINYGKRLPPTRLKWPERKPIVLYPPILIIAAFYLLEKLVPPILHILVGVLLFTAIHNTLYNYEILLPENSWPIARNLLIGLIMTSIISLIANAYYYLIPSIILYTGLTLILEKHYNRRALNHGESPSG